MADVKYAPEYLAMIVIGALFLTFGFTGICISIISIFITRLSIYSKTFLIVSVIVFVIGLALLIPGVVVGKEKSKVKEDKDNIGAINNFIQGGGVSSGSLGGVGLGGGIPTISSKIVGIPPPSIDGAIVVDSTVNE